MSYSHLSPLFFNWISRNHSLSIHISSQLWMLKNAINISDCIYSKFLRLYLFQKNIDIKRVRAYYSKRDIESWQLTGCRSSYKYISRSMDPVIGQLPSNSIFMEQDHRPKSDLLWQSTRDLFFIYIYIYLFVTFPSFSCFPGLYLFLYLHHPPMLSRGCLICCRRYRTDGSFFHFSRIPSPLLNRSTFCPESSEFWLRVVKQMFGESARTWACNRVLHGKRRICWYLLSMYWSFVVVPLREETAEWAFSMVGTIESRIRDRMEM